MINFAKYERMMLEAQIDAGLAYLSAVGIGMLFTGYDVSQLRIRVDADGMVIREWQPLNRHPVHYLRGCEWAIEQRVDFETAVNVVEFVATLPQTYGILREDDNPDLIEVFVPLHACRGGQRLTGACPGHRDRCVVPAVCCPPRPPWPSIARFGITIFPCAGACHE